MESIGRPYRITSRKMNDRGSFSMRPVKIAFSCEISFWIIPVIVSTLFFLAFLWPLSMITFSCSSSVQPLAETSRQWRQSHCWVTSHGRRDATDGPEICRWDWQCLCLFIRLECFATESESERCRHNQRNYANNDAIPVCGHTNVNYSIQFNTIQLFSPLIIFRIGTRFDCGGCFCIVLCLLDKKGEAILFNMSDAIIPSGENWIETTTALNIVNEIDRFDDIQSLAILVCGKDTQYWKGHFGTKCARISVNLKCLSQIEAENVGPHIKYVTNPQNAHIFIGNFWQSLLPNRSMGRCPYSRAPRN